MTDLREQIRNLVTSYEEERLLNADREHETRERLTVQIKHTEAKAKEREDDLIDIIRELRDGLTEAVFFIEIENEDLAVVLRTIAARATDLLVNAGIESWTG